MKTIVVALAMFVAASAFASVPASQRDALIAIYNASDGPSWTGRGGWLGAAGTECSWYGVVCNDAQTSVVEIILVANNLGGTISPSIGSFPDLRTLLLYDNALAGEIPATIGQLTNLDTIVL